MRKALLQRVLIAAAMIILPSVSAFAFRAGDLEITPVISAEERYDDNITYVKDNRTDDFITTLSLGIDVVKPEKIQKLQLSGRVTGEMFAQEKDFNNVEEELALGYNKELSKRDRITLKEAFTHAETPTSFADEFGSTNGRNAYYLNRFNFGYTKEVREQLSLTAGYQDELYDRTEKDQTDSTLHAIDLRSDYSLNSSTIISGIYDFSQRDGSPGDNINSHTVDAALRQFLTKQLFADFIVGVSFIDVTGLDQDYTKPRFQFTLTDDVSEKTRGSLTFLKRYDTTSYQEDVLDQWRTSGKLDHRLGERLGLGLEIFYGEGEYRNLNIKDKLSGANVRLGYELSSRSSAYISQAYSKNASNSDSREYTKDVTRVGMQIKF